MRRIVPLILALLATPAHAQTAEETMLYMLHGFEGSPIAVDFHGHQMTMESYPELENGILLKIATPIPDMYQRGAYGLTKIDDCTYSVTVLAAKVGSDDLPLTPLVTATMDWSKVSGLSFDSTGGILTAIPDGIKIDCDAQQPSCATIKAAPLFYLNLGSQRRVEKAFQYFQANYCKGSAF